MDILQNLMSGAPQFFLIMARTSGLFTIGPVFSSRYLPVPVRVFLCLYTSYIIFLIIPNGLRLPLDSVSYALRLLGEVVVGLGIGYVGTLILSAFQVAGQLIDTELGLGVVNVLDPHYGLPVPLMGNFLYLLVLLMLITMDGHHLILRAFVDSFLEFPVGAARVNPDMYQYVSRLFTSMLLTALRVAAPVLAAGFLTNLALGMIGRSMPQMNVFVLGLPLKLLTGMIVLALSIPMLGPTVRETGLGIARAMLSFLRWQGT